MRKTFVQAVLAVVCGALLCSAFSSAAVAASPGEEEILVKYFDLTRGKLVFTYSKESKPQIYVLDFATLLAKAVISGPGGSWGARFSPDGKKLVFVSDRSGAKEIYTANPDGSGVQQVTSIKTGAQSPDWSPDGKQIVFVADKGAGSELTIINADGSNPVAIAKSSKQYSDPRWSPLGREILFATNEYWPGSDLLSVDIPSKKITVLTTGYGSWSEPTWSPGGKHYAFVYGPNEDPDIWVRSIDDVKGKAFVTRQGKDIDPEWVDSKDLFFLGEVIPGSGHYEIYLYEVETNQVLQVTESPGDMRDLSWYAAGPIQREAPAETPTASASATPTPAPEFGDKPASASSEPAVSGAIIMPPDTKDNQPTSEVQPK